MGYAGEKSTPCDPKRGPNKFTLPLIEPFFASTAVFPPVQDAIILGREDEGSAVGQGLIQALSRVRNQRGSAKNTAHKP